MAGLAGGIYSRNADRAANPNTVVAALSPLCITNWTMQRAGIVSIVLFIVLICTTMFPAVSWAEDLDMYPVADEFQQEVERTAAEYDAAVAALAQAKADIQENTVRIDELSAEIPEQQQRGATAARELYKLQQQGSGLIQMLLGSDDFYDFLTSLDYLNRIGDAHLQELQKLEEMQSELETRQVALEKAHSSAAKQADKAEQALAAAQEARLEAQRRAQEEARRQAEEAAAAAAAAAAEAEAAAEAAAAEAAAQAAAEEEAAQADKQQEDGQTVSSEASEAAEEAKQDAPEEEPAEAEEPQQTETVFEQPSDDGADWTSEQATFINEWSARIDAYLAGSPLAGQGTTFAKAAWDYGVDPRWSPAIAFTESSLGLNCFLPHNAWGWGSASWGSWEEAIPAHVAGLARGYGYTISIENAQKYCPPNWEAWYNRTLAQMNMI